MIGCASLAALMAAARERSQQLPALVDELMRAQQVMAPTAALAAVWNDDFLFVAESDQAVEIAIDGDGALAMEPLAGTRYWTHLTQLELGATHNYEFRVDGDRYGFPAGPGSVAGYTPLSYRLPGAPTGTISERRTITSSIYGGAAADYWLYVNHGIDEARGAPVMVWLDGLACVGDLDALNMRMQTVTDNLVHRGQMPPTVHVLLQPSVGGTRQPEPDGLPPLFAMRSLQFDSLTEEFGRYLLDELLPEVGTSVKLRRDGYSRAIAGASSGGSCAFKVGWFEPAEFSRIHSTIGSFTALGWHPEQGIEGCHVLPLLVRRERRRNLRVWLSDGAYDIDAGPEVARWQRSGSWPLSNLALAQALKTSGYDFHFRFGEAGHNLAQWSLDLPESLAWLWRGYDPERTEQVYEQEPAERAKPVFRVGVVNRDAW